MEKISNTQQLDSLIILYNNELKLRLGIKYNNYYKVNMSNLF
jgi:hypothetical protein